MMSIQAHLFGKTGRRVTCVGLGGEGVLRTYDRAPEAEAVIDEAMNAGITYFDSANAYAGSEGYYGAYYGSHPGTRGNVFQTSKSAERDKESALAELENTLKTMHIDHLDLWQIHDVRTQEDVDAIEAPGGALEAFVEAKKAGRTRYIGVTGHHDPSILKYAVEHWPVDSVLLPVNPVEGALGGFIDGVMTAALDRGIAVIGMKIMGHSGYISPETGITPELLLRYALSQGITVAIVGCSTPGEVRTLASVGHDFMPVEPQEQGALIEAFKPYAKRLAYYRGVF
jgi:aryl-alcohol dehydrogenase-like predicted oxidoreductase